ncbi:NAD(P)-binding protein, partial [Periconia macrospinosa]
TGTLGRAIVDGLVNAGGFEVLVLTREANEAKSKELGARLVAVDYSNIDNVATVLESSKVETVVSTLGTVAGSDPEVALIKGADQSSVTKRYITSNWGINYPLKAIDFYPAAKQKIDAQKTLEKTSLEYTTVLNGVFLDYYVAPYVKSYMPAASIVIDLPANAAAIPGSGDVPVVFTHSLDIARFTVALLTLPKWDKASYIIGDKITWNQFLKIAEEAKGTKFDIAYDPVEKLKRGEVTELPTHRSIYPFYPKANLQIMMSGTGLLTEQGFFDLKPAHSLNDIFPEIRPRSVRELVEVAW